MAELTHVYGVFHERGARTTLLGLRRAEASAREAALTEGEKRGGGFTEIPPSYPHGPAPDVFAWCRREDRGASWPSYVFVRKLELKD